MLAPHQFISFLSLTIFLMRKLRGFKLRKRFVLFSRWLCRNIRPATRYYRLSQEDSSPEPKLSSRLLSWRRGLSFLRRAEPVQEKCNPVPKGQLAVYVGESGGEFSRVLVPVVYFKHRLFIELLREAEDEYGFEHKKGITFPCGYSEFERILTRIRDCRYWRSSGSCCSPEEEEDVWRLEARLRR
ncbi:auxin-responsive protein SAUR36-like [Cucurbita maxima]|uniref:Auxin-responsive protein SAUR36-like n=1 Tax=Cucurbita maxima TaxID=3661 RepID=A0A6J1L2T6_CUCMA|nr:auxin-responsive protein SAUR36-like [Cucurbita maxima]